jgi:hypothetical protein
MDAQEIFDLTMAARQAAIQPDRMAHDRAWSSRMLGGIDGGRAAP